MVDFRTILNTRAEDVKRPPLLPAGTYRAKVTKYSFDKIANGRFDVIDFQMLPLEAQLDVDPESLEQYGGLGPNSVQRHRFMFNNDDTPEAKAGIERTTFNLKNFLTDHIQASGETLNEQIANSAGCECLITVKWRPDPDNPEIQYAQIAKTAPLPQ